MSSHPVLRLVVVALIALVALIQPRQALGQATPVASASTLDLPAIVLTPADLLEIGLSGFERKGNGDLRRFDDYVAARAEFLNMDPAALEQLLTEAGWQAGFVTNLALATEPGNPDSPESAVVFTAVHAYADAEGAALAYEGNYDYSGVTGASVDADIGPADTVGDSSFMVRTIGTPEPEMGPSDEIALIVRVDRLITSVGIIRYGLTEADLASPVPVDETAMSQVQAMADLVMARMQDALAMETPGLFPRVARFGGDTPLAFESEGYRLIRGTVPPYYGGFEDDFPSMAAGGEFQAAYELNQALASPAEPFFLVRLFAFDSEDAASAFLATREAEPFESGELVEGVLDDVAPGGVLTAYVFQPSPDFSVEGYAAYFAVGSTVAFVLIEGPTRPSDAVITELVATQLACLESPDPCAPILPPAELMA